MPYFPLVGWQHWVLAIFLGLISLILVYLAFGSHAGRREEKAGEGPEEERDLEILRGHDGEKNPVPPLLVFIYGGVILFAVGYLIVIGIWGSAF